MDIAFLGPTVTLVVGSFAVILYILNKRSEKRNAAAIIVMDVRHAESLITQLKQAGYLNGKIRKLSPYDNWNKYKHLFVSEISSDDFYSITEFFAYCSDIDESQNRVSNLFDQNLIAKIKFAQEKILSLNPETPNFQTERDKIIVNIDKEVWAFDPIQPKEIIVKNITNITKISNTLGFHKIRKIAKIQ